jgi:conjugative transposon TraN protein
MKPFRQTILRTIAVLVAVVCALGVRAQKTFSDMEQLTVNEKVTTVITASEPIRLVDMSTDTIAGDKPLENVVRLKPKKGEHKDGEMLGIVTIITERYRVQYALIYTSKPEEAVSDKEVELTERYSFHNPAVSMSTKDMVGYAMKVWQSPARYRNTYKKQLGLKMRLNNIYTVGDYFFIDFSVENTTNLPFDIDDIRVTLEDKKQEKATNVQVLELTPALILNQDKRFKKGYRNVIVLRKMTFPNDKVLTLELEERQISGRTIRMSLDYEDILSADSFDTLLLKEG